MQGKTLQLVFTTEPIFSDFPSCFREVKNFQTNKYLLSQTLLFYKHSQLPVGKKVMKEKKTENIANRKFEKKRQ